MRFIAFILLFLAQQAEMDQATVLFQQGNEFYQQGDYQKAAEQYELALQSGYESEKLYYNIGNAYFKLNNIARSILNYERAKKLAPRDEDIKVNLQLAQLHVVDKIVTPPPFYFTRIWHQIKNYFSIDQLSFFTIIFYVLTISVFIVKLLIKKETVQKFSYYALLPSFIIFLIFCGLLFSRIHEEKTNVEGIVMTEKVEVLSSPSEDATEVFALHEGVKIKVNQRSGQYFRISLPDGKVGWLPQSALEVI